MNKTFLRPLLTLVVLVFSACLTACDGSFHMTPEGAVKDASVREIVRGMATSHEQIEEDPGRSDARKDLFELVASKAGVDLSKGLLATLQANPHYSAIEVKAADLAPGDETVVLIAVRFKVDNKAAVQLNFLSPQKTVFGPIRMSKLPILDGIQAVTEGHQLELGNGNEDILTSILNADQDNLAHRVATQIAKAKEVTAKANTAVNDQAASASNDAPYAPAAPTNATVAAPPSEPIYRPERALAQTFRTLAGVMSMLKDEQGTSHVTLDMRPIFTGNDAGYQQPVRLLQINDQAEAVLMKSSGGRGTRCDTLFFFIILNKYGQVRWTPEFGTCADGGSITQVGEEIRLDIPKIGGFAHFRLLNGLVTDEHGVPVKSDPDTDPAQ